LRINAITLATMKSTRTGAAADAMPETSMVPSTSTTTCTQRGTIALAGTLDATVGCSVVPSVITAIIRGGSA